MRAVDADALRKKLEEYVSFGGTGTEEFDKGYDVGIQKAIEMLDNAPIIFQKEFEPLLEAIIDILPTIVEAVVETIPAIVEKTERPTGEWNNHKVACLLAELFDDACACNYCGIDEWLPQKCDFANKECPDVVGVACWEQFLKHRTKLKGEPDGED